eukprot:CAMPEP_0183440282 /NCGR_PEP_ID=MMETSP0370-20130417/80881_1 /TAXON_ID=268820 /ORGANISM="Peridinium aciculiferum, Strain PAER-2" /LENGTH=56 /DNA_ID=CAMNT_0025629073 /DNA_START=27 /DNA_END=194 /DNA_ORIENTATION=+
MSLDGALRTLFSSSCFQLRNRDAGSRLGPELHVSVSNSPRGGQSQAGGARKENRLL